MAEDQVLGFDTERKDYGYGLPSTRDEESLASFCSLDDVRSVSLEISYPDCRHWRLIVVADVTTCKDRSYSNAGDKHRYLVALGDTKRIQIGISERAASIC